MTAAPAAAREEPATQSPEAVRTVESGEFSIEGLFAEKGKEALEKLAGEETMDKIKRVKMLAEVPMDVAKTATEAVSQLNAVREKTEHELLEAKKKLLLALGEGETSESALGKAAETQANDPIAEQKIEEPVELSEEEAIPLTKVKSIPVSEADKDEMVIEPTISAEAKAAAETEVPSGRESAQEELEIPAVMEAGPDIDWIALMREEDGKLVAAEKDYQEAEKALTDFREQRPGALTPIEQKYVGALEAQIEMDRLAAAHAKNQKSLYEINKRVGELGNKPDAGIELDALIEQRNTKDQHSKNLAEQYEAAVAEHDRILEEYESSLEAFSAEDESAEPQEAVAEDESAEMAPGGDSTGGSIGGGSFERPLYLTEEDEKSFEARQAGVTKKGPGVLERMKAAAKSAGNPEMQLDPKGGGFKEKKKDQKEKKKRKSFFKWLFGIKQ